MKKFETHSTEIHIEPWADYAQPDPIAQEIDRQGKEGWQCVGFRRIEGKNCIMYFQREVIENM